ncbi:MAG: hypothetical protein ACI97K_003429 [Glaciecola sp.]|jgi:hypothetical protein
MQKTDYFIYECADSCEVLQFGRAYLYFINKISIERVKSCESDQTKRILDNNKSNQ